MIYQFDDIVLDTRSYRLHCAGQLQDVEPQVFEVLVVLVENRDRMVSKDELIDLVWRGRVVSDTAVSSRIKSARRAIGDDGKAQRLIKTRHGRGYQFIGALSAGDTGTGSFVAAHKESKPQAAAEDQRPCIVMLPLASLGIDAHLSVLPEGLSHDIILGLSRLRWLRVIARASSFQFTSRDGAAALLENAAADYCLAGAIEQSGTLLILTIELIQVADNSILWVERIEARLDDVHQMRSEVVNKAIAALETQISLEQARLAQFKSPDSLDAWSAYHLGLRHMYRFTPEDNRTATTLFEHAVALEPLFARAHAGLSFCRFQDAFNQYAGTDSSKAVALARASADRSVELDSLDPFSNFVMGRCYWLEGDSEASLPWLERAVSINPNFAQGHYSHGLAAVMCQHDVDSHSDAEAAISLSPLDPFMYGFYGVRALSYLADGDYDNARLWANKAAHQPGALIVMDLIAVAANDLAGCEQAAAHWAARARGRNSQLLPGLLFSALPFSRGEFRDRLCAALARFGL